jgi:hypothetical protein
LRANAFVCHQQAQDAAVIGAHAQECEERAALDTGVFRCGWASHTVSQPTKLSAFTNCSVHLAHKALLSVCCCSLLLLPHQHWRYGHQLTLSLSRHLATGLTLLARACFVYMHVSGACMCTRFALSRATIDGAVTSGPVGAVVAGTTLDRVSRDNGL